MEEILIINKQKEIDFSNEYIRNFWLHSNKTTNIKQESNLITFIGNLEKVTEFINQASEMLCIYSSEFSNEIYNLILDTSTSKRIYFLTNDKSLGKDQLQSLAGNILIRLIKTNYQGSVLLSDVGANFNGLFFNGTLSAKDLEDQNRFLLRLEDEQKEYFIQLYNEWFWKEAEKEILTKDQAENPINIESQPFDFIFPNPDYISVEGIEKTISEIIAQKTNVHISLKNIDNHVANYLNNSVSNLCVYTNLINNNIDKLNILLNNNNSMFVYEGLENENNWEFVTNQNDKFIIINRKNSNQLGWVFNLTLQQIQDFLNILNNVNIVYTYINEEKRTNLINKKIYLPDENREIMINEIDEKILKKIEIPDLISIHDKNDFESNEPKQFIDPKYASKVIYHWEIHPPFLPKNSQKDSLYHKWEKSHLELHKSIENLLVKIEELDSSEGFLTRLSNFFHSSNYNNLNEMKKVEEIKQTISQKNYTIFLKKKGRNFIVHWKNYVMILKKEKI